MEMNTDIYTYVYVKLRKWLKENLTYSVNVTKLSKEEENRFPLVVITEEENSLLTSTLNREETYSKLYYEINIYARDKVINDEHEYAIDIARDISRQVDALLGQKYGMQRISCRPTPNLDNSIYRITMRYSVTLDDNRMKFIK